MAFSLGREELRRLWSELRGPGRSPLRVGLGVALGLWAGAFALHGAELPALAIACILLRLDGLVAFFAWASSSLGRLIADHHAACAPRALWAWCSLLGQSPGWPLVGVGASLVCGALAAAVVAAVPRGTPRAPYRLPHDAPAWVIAIERVAGRYGSAASPSVRERAHFHYIRAKLLADPVARLLAEIAEREPLGLGQVLDVGSGRGQLALLLLELGRASSTHGIDWDARKVALAQRAADGARARGALLAEARGRSGKTCSGPGSPEAADRSARPLAAVFERGDARSAPLPPADTVLLVDVLHYVAPGEQDSIVARAAATLRPGGRMLVRVPDSASGLRTLATLVEERVFTAVRFNRGERVRFRSVRDVVASIEAAGLRCRWQPAWANTPFSNVLIVAGKPGPSAMPGREGHPTPS